MKIIKAIAKVIATLLGIGAAMVVLAGCSTPPKTRSIEADGMYANAASETIAIGSVEVMSAPQGEESAFIKYDEKNAWLQPSMKLHNITVQLTGTNTTVYAKDIVKSISKAFIAAKPVQDFQVEQAENTSL